jgi:type I restriction enzyme S subunit
MENGKIALAANLHRGVGAGSTEFHVLRPTAAAEAKFLMYYMLREQFRKDARAKMTGTAGQLRVPASFLQQRLVAVPPLPEQRRIISAIESCLSKLDAAVALLEHARSNLKRYRASVLKATVEGVLYTAVAEEQAFRKPYWVAIEQIVNSLDQGWSPKCMREGSSDPNVWSVIKTTAVQPLTFDPLANKVLPQNLQPRPNLEIADGDVLITRAGPRIRVGVCCCVAACRPRLMLCDKVYRLRVKPDRVAPRFLAIVLNSSQLQADIERLKSGISDSGLNLTQNGVLHLRVPLPSPSTQMMIVQAIDDVMTTVQHAEAAVSEDLIRISTLRQSILKWAFEGKLVSQGPADEPASVLLERIRAERAARASSRKVHKPAGLQAQAAK